MDDQLKALGDKFTVRMPDGMRDAIAAEARKNNRSMNAEIVARLSESLQQETSATHIGSWSMPLKDLELVLQEQFQTIEKQMRELKARIDDWRPIEAPPINVEQALNKPTGFKRLNKKTRK